MQDTVHSIRTPLPEVLDEASCALATLDAGRLEELASSCEAFNKELFQLNMSSDPLSLEQVLTVRNKLADFGRVLEATRCNLEVLRQANAFDTGVLEYANPAHAWVEEPKRDGND
ncbi:MAG: hypothetical protein KGN79_01985 [Acidobacteriota bacterium]|nr:hypothetical protein [Acidobacteriota bacterium]